MRSRSQLRKPASKSFPVRKLLGRICARAVTMVILGLGALGIARAAEPALLRLGVLHDAPPFSSRTDHAEPKGYSVDLCVRIAEEALRQGLFEQWAFVDVTAQDRFQRLEHGDIDILCGATSLSLERMRHFDFTFATFVSGASYIFRESDRELGLETLADRRLGVLKQTTTESFVEQGGLASLLRQSGVAAESKSLHVVGMADHYEGIEQLIRGDIDAYFADREILLALQKRADQRRPRVRLSVSNRYLSHEPYALALRLAPASEPCKTRRALLYAANLTLVNLFTDGDIAEVFQRHFPGKAMSPVLRELFARQQVPIGAPLDYLCEQSGASN